MNVMTLLISDIDEKIILFINYTSQHKNNHLYANLNMLNMFLKTTEVYIKLMQML